MLWIESVIDHYRIGQLIAMDIIHQDSRREVIEAETDSGRWIIKSTTIHGRHFRLRDAIYIQAQLAQFKIPCPTPLAVRGEHIWQTMDRSIYVYQKLPGVPISDNVEQWAEAVGKVLSRLHGIGRKLLENECRVPKPQPWMARGKPNKKPTVQATKIEKSQGDCCLQTVVHGDCHWRNIIDQGDNIGFVDWDLCRRGYPCEDFGTLLASRAQKGSVTPQMKRLFKSIAKGYTEYGGAEAPSWKQAYDWALYTLEGWRIRSQALKDTAHAFDV